MFRIILVLALLSCTLVSAEEHGKVVALDIISNPTLDDCGPIYRVEYPSGTKFYDNAEPRKVFSGHKIVLNERAYTNHANGSRTVFCGYFLYEENGQLIHWFDTTDFELSRTKDGYKLLPLDRSVDNREAYAPNFEGLTPHTL